MKFDARKILSEKLKLRRLDPAAEPAGLMICSLPAPRQGLPAVTLDGRPTFRQPIGQWPGEPAGRPRRLLLIADGGTKAPAAIRAKAGLKNKSGGEVPGAALELFEKSPEPAFMWEHHLVRITWNNVSIGLALGLKTKGEIHWWEACGLSTREVTPTCRAIEAGGAIPLELETLEHIQKHPGYKNPFLHRHNWLNGHIYARLHANGVCEIYAHHINSKYDDEGLPLENAVPVIGLSVRGAESDMAALTGAWTGDRPEFALGPIRFDVRDAARLATTEQPGSMSVHNEFLVWQPYQGVDWFGGLCPLDRTGDEYITKAKDQVIPRGMARTVRFSFSLTPDRSPAVARYLAPGWWYGLCEELVPAPLLPVVNAYDVSLEASHRAMQATARQGGFEDGALARHARKAGERPEPSWEGETPYGLMLHAWRTGDAAAYDLALRSAYHMTDVAIDHAAKLVRMHGYAAGAYALPMARIHSTLGAYLETGDPYLLNEAVAVTDNSYWVHKNSWPRMCIGRDACFIRGAVLLYRYLGDDHYRTMAYDAARDVGVSQRPDGSFGDQGGGAGIHGWGAYITKPWMGFMAVGGLLDYLEVVGDDAELLGTVKRFADWLMSERFDHDGVKGWSYQHNYNGGREFRDIYSGQAIELPSPGLWHMDYPARMMTYCSLRFRDPSYFEAWAESYAKNPEKRTGDHDSTQSFQFLPWVQARLWNARLTNQGVVCEPMHFGPRTPTEGTVQTPDGPARLQWSGPGKVRVVAGKIAAVKPKSVR